MTLSDMSATRKIFFLLLCLAVCAGMTSCRRKLEKARENICVEAVERVGMRGLTELDVVLRLRNDTGYKLVLDKASLDIFMGPSFVVGAELCDPVTAERHTTQSIATRWRLRISDPFTLYAFARRIRQQQIASVAVDCAAEGRCGPVPLNIFRGKVPLYEFLNTFGVELEELQNLFEP